MFDAVGGAGFFEAMVDHFYDAVLTNDVLRPLYPEDLAEARRHTALFLMQYWGGPSIYNEERGHPRLRMRHIPFAIGQPERDAWLDLMLAGLDHALAGIPHPPLADQIREAIAGYLDHASTAMINQP